jgi:ubiquinone/menaquinone biosynthesis C-methylase UbiE
MTYTQKDGTERWDRNATAWHERFGEKDPNRSDLLDPIILDVLGDVRGKRILDAGCGDGYLSRKLARLGAAVTGVECAEVMIAFALNEQKRRPLSITYDRGDITSMPFISDGAFDIVLTNNVIQDVADYEAAFDEFARVVKKGGLYLHIENHPCFATPYTAWAKDEKGEKLYRRVDNYFARGPWLANWGPRSGMEPTIAWHRTLGDIMNGLTARGFRIEKVIEPEPPDVWRTAHPERMDAARIPDFIVLVCRRE